MIEQAGAAGDHKLRIGPARAQQYEGFEQSQCVFPLFDTADRQHDRRPGAHAEPLRQRGIGDLRDRAEALAVDAVAHLGSIDAVLATEDVSPQPAHAKDLARTTKAARLPEHQLRRREDFEVMHRPHEAVDQPFVLQVGQRVAADRVVRVQHVERLRLDQSGQVRREGFDAITDHLHHVVRRATYRHQLRRASQGPEEALTRCRGGHHGDVVAGIVQRMGQFDRVDHAAARVHGVGQQADAKRPWVVERVTHGRPPPSSRLRRLQLGR